MLVFVFLEINNERKPLYAEEFNKCLKSVSTGNGIIVASKEYKALALDKECVLQIPDSIMNDIDNGLVSPENRGLFLCINKNNALIDWISEILSNKDVTGILLMGRYYDFISAAKKNNVSIYYSEIIDGKTEDITRGVLEKEEDYRNQINSLTNDLHDLREEIKDKNEQIAQFHNRIGSLQEELYNRKNQVKALEEQWEYAEKKVDKIEDEKFLYLKMYKSFLKELDETKVELLNLRKK